MAEPPDPQSRAGTPEPEQPAPPASGQFAAAPAVPEVDVDYVHAEDLTTEQPVLPRALRRAAALADAPAELPDHEAAYLQELAARPGIVALRPRSARPDSPVAGTPQAAPPWPLAAYLSRPAPYLSPQAASPGQAKYGASFAGAGLAPAPDAGPALDDEAPSAADTADTAAGDGVPMTRLLPVSRLNRPRKPGETGQWPTASGPAQAPTDTAV